MKTFQAETLTDLHEVMCRHISTAPLKKLDVVTSVDVQIHNVMAECGSMEWDFDLKNMWLTKSRWSMMIRQYLDPDDVNAWLERCATTIGMKGRGIAVLRTKTVAARGGPAQGNKETRRWGSCMLAVSYKAKPHPQITLYSRTSYLGYLGALDLSVAWMLGRYLAAMMGVDVADFRFVWMNEAVQYHMFKSLAYYLNHRNKDERKKYRRLMMKPDKKLTDREGEMIAASPALSGSRKWMQKLLEEDRTGVTLGDMNYNTYRRIRRRFHTEVKGLDYAKEFEGWSYYKTGPKKGEEKEFFKAYQELPSTPISSCNFAPIGLPPIDRLGRIDYDAAIAIEEDDEDDD
jgi:hypothetical protein